jgi:hypothetical protein
MAPRNDDAAPTQDLNRADFSESPPSQVPTDTRRRGCTVETPVSKPSSQMVSREQPRFALAKDK